MNLRKLTCDRVCGVISIIIGIISLIECKRLYPMRNSLLAGDHAFLGMTGIAMIILGIFLIFIVKPKQFKVVFPENAVMIKLMGSLIILFIYSVCITFLGYIIPTAVFGIILFRLFGGYSWIKCVIISVLSTAGLYAVFIYALDMSFPKGIF